MSDHLYDRGRNVPISFVLYSKNIVLRGHYKRGRDALFYVCLPQQCQVSTHHDDRHRHDDDDVDEEEEEEDCDSGSKRARRDSSSSVGSSLSMEMPPLFSNGVVGQTTSHLVNRETDLSLNSLLSRSQVCHSLRSFHGVVEYCRGL